MGQLQDDSRLDPFLRTTSIGKLNTSTISISATVLSAVPVTIVGVTTGSFASNTQVQAIADAVRELRYLVQDS